MSDPLDLYLQQLEQSLMLLPQPRREAEMEEVCQHLMALSEPLREQGLSEEAAAQAAFTQFGKPQKVGRELVRAWRREQLLRWRGTLGGALGWSLIAHYAQGWLSPLAHHLIMPRVLPTSAEWIGFLATVSVAWTITLTFYFLIGWSTGRVTPRHAMQGALLSLVIFSTWGTLRMPPLVLSASNSGAGPGQFSIFAPFFPDRGSLLGQVLAILPGTFLWMGLAVGVTIWGVSVGRRQSSDFKKANKAELQ